MTKWTKPPRFAIGKNSSNVTAGREKMIKFHTYFDCNRNKRKAKYE